MARSVDAGFPCNVSLLYLCMWLLIGWRPNDLIDNIRQSTYYVSWRNRSRVLPSFRPSSRILPDFSSCKQYIALVLLNCSDLVLGDQWRQKADHCNQGNHVDESFSDELRSSSVRGRRCRRLVTLLRNTFSLPLSLSLSLYIYIYIVGVSILSFSHAQWCVPLIRGLPPRLPSLPDPRAETRSCPVHAFVGRTVRGSDGFPVGLDLSHDRPAVTAKGRTVVNRRWCAACGHSTTPAVAPSDQPTDSWHP